MDTKSFLERVTASAGNYVLTVLKESDGRKIVWQWGNYDTIDDFINDMSYVDRQQDLTAYFAVGTHINNTELKENGKTKVLRTKETAHLFRALCFDIDVGPDKPYTTQRDAGKDLLRALKEIGLPQPMFVSSGYGVHCYWPLTADISAASWEKLSLALAGAMQKHDVKLDFSKAYDTSMVLRPVGSHNKKDPMNWQEVRVLKDSPDYDVIALATVLKPYNGLIQPSRKPVAPARASAVMDAILNSKEFPPVNLDQVAEGCAQVRALLATGGVTDAAGQPVQEPLWRTSLGLVKYTENVNVSVVRIAGQHPEFDLQSSLDKMYQWQGTGPATCAAFEKLCPSGCNGCPNRGTITTPAALTRGETVVVVEDGEETEELKLPWPYLHKDGKVYREFTNVRKDKDASGKNVDVEFIDTELVCPYLIWPVARYSDDERGTSLALVKAKYPVEGVKEFEIPLSILAAGGVELNKLFGNRQIFLRNDDLLRKTRGYLMTYLQEIQTAVDTSYVYTRMGWQPDGSFLCGSKLIGSNVTDFKTSGLAKSLRQHIRPHGSREKWVEATSIFNHQDALLQGFMFMVGAGGLVMQGSTIESVLFNFFSPDSGAGKSVTQAFICSLWGDYQKLFLYPADTDNSLYKSFGAMNSLTPCIDEITTIDTDRLTDMLYSIPQGREKKRMTADAELRIPATWKAPIISSSNKDLYAMVDNVMGAQAQKLRLFQGYFEVTDLFSKNGKRIILTLQDNFGHAAPEIVEEIIRRGGPKAVYMAALERFEEKYKFTFEGAERYIEAGFICAEAIGPILVDLGLIAFDYEACIRRGLKEMVKIRRDNTVNSVDAFDILAQYLHENNAFLIEYRENRSMTTSKGMVRQPAPDHAVGRLEITHDANTPILPGSRLILNKPLLRKDLARRGFDYTKFIMEMQADKAYISDTDRYSIFKGCDRANPGQAYCVVLDLYHPRLRAAIAENKLGGSATAPRLAVLATGTP